MVLAPRGGNPLIGPLIDPVEGVIPPSASSGPSLLSWPSLREPPVTVSRLPLSLVAGSLLGFGGGCFRGYPTSSSSSPPPTEWSDWDRTVKPWLGGGVRSCGAGIVMKPIRKCFPAYAPSVAVATSSPILNGPMKKQVVEELYAAKHI